MASPHHRVHPRQQLGRRLLLACALGLWACGGSSSTPTAPTSGGTPSTPAPAPSAGGSTSGGTFAIAVDGAPFGAISVSAVCSTPGPEIVTIVAVSGSGASTSSLSFTALAQPGVQTIAASQFTLSTMTVIAANTSSGFLANQTLGRGNITITSLSATNVAGSVDLVLVPSSGATTNRVITGTFNVPIASNGACRSPGGTIPPGTPAGGTPVPTTGTFTASINGASFNGALGLTATLVNGQLSVSGSDNQYALQFVVPGVQAPGTFTISGSSAVVAGLSQVGTAQTWFASAVSGSGSITITSLSSTTVAGTFTLTLAPGSSTSGTRTVTNGTFSVPLSTSTAVPPSVPTGPTATGTTGLVMIVDGAEWRPTVSTQATRTAQGFVTIGAADVSLRAFSMAILASAPGTYSLNTPNSHNALYAQGQQQWFTSRPGGGGSVTIASISTTRVTGSFEMTLAPGANNTDLRTIRATGTFDLSF